MKKSLIALAVAGAFAAPAAMAEVTISGAINVGIALIDSDDSVGGTPGDGQNRTSLATNYSNINISSSDDIGNGNRVILNVQINAGALNNTSGFTNRNSYLGIEGSWGSFKMGTNENVYERWFYESDPLDGAMGIGGNIQMLGQTGLAGAGWFDVGNGDTVDNGSFWRRTHHTIWYTSPNWNGFTFEIDQTLSAFKSTVAGQTVDPTITSIGGQYKPDGMPFFVNIGYEKHNETLVDFSAVGGSGTDLVDATGLSFGGGYTFGPALITARWESLEWKDKTGGGGKVERDHLWVGLKWSLPTGYVGAEFGMANKLKVNGSDLNNSEATMVGLGYFHNLSKQSQVYAVGTVISNDDNANYGIGAGTGSTGGFGSDHTAITVGIKHVF